MELFQNSIYQFKTERQQNAETLKNLFLSPVDDLLKNDLKNQDSLKREWSNAVVDYESKIKRIRKGLDQSINSEQLVLKKTATDYFIKRNQVRKSRPQNQRILLLNVGDLAAISRQSNYIASFFLPGQNGTD